MMEQKIHTSRQRLQVAEGHRFKLNLLFCPWFLCRPQIICGGTRTSFDLNFLRTIGPLQLTSIPSTEVICVDYRQAGDNSGGAWFAFIIADSIGDLRSKMARGTLWRERCWEQEGRLQSAQDYLRLLNVSIIHRMALFAAWGGRCSVLGLQPAGKRLTLYHHPPAPTQQLISPCSNSSCGWVGKQYSLGPMAQRMKEI